jgi:hypothetical protein
MKNVNHSDNACTIGWTNIHAYMTHKDMVWLLKIEPRGKFTPTFYVLPESWEYSWNTQTGILRNMQNVKHHRFFYFEFPVDSPLLVILELKNKTHTI